MLLSSPKPICYAQPSHPKVLYSWYWGHGETLSYHITTFYFPACDMEIICAELWPFVLWYQLRLGSRVPQLGILDPINLSHIHCPELFGECRIKISRVWMDVLFTQTESTQAGTNRNHVPIELEIWLIFYNCILQKHKIQECYSNYMDKPIEIEITPGRFHCFWEDIGMGTE